MTGARHYFEACLAALCATASVRSVPYTVTKAIARNKTGIFEPMPSGRLVRASARSVTANGPLDSVVSDPSEYHFRIASDVLI